MPRGTQSRKFDKPVPEPQNGKLDFFAIFREQP
jgi:hypothetical protein